MPPSALTSGRRHVGRPGADSDARAARAAGRTGPPVRRAADADRSRAADPGRGAAPPPAVPWRSLPAPRAPGPRAPLPPRASPATHGNHVELANLVHGVEHVESRHHVV